MKILLIVVLGLIALCAARDRVRVDFELDNHEQKQEVQEGSGGTALEGEYSWVAPDGNEYYVKYVADHLGYRIVEDNVVPKAPEHDVEEVENEDE